MSCKPFVSLWVRGLALATLCALVAGVQAAPDPRAGRVVVKYWEKWNGFEADAMRAVVDDFNQSQNRIWVDYSSVSQIDRRLMLAIAGGVPPDIAGVWGLSIPVYSENNALTPLDKLAAEKGLGPDRYIPVFWDTCRHEGHLWGLPSTPTTLALVYNKKMFREVGLDPERPPRSIAELEAFNEKLLRRSPDGGIEAIGFLPEEPGWWNGLWGYWWGGEMLRDGKVNVASPEIRSAYEWVQSYPERFGVRELLAFRDGFGNYASPQNPFFNGRVAMVLQGVWIHNFIQNYAPPDFEWGVAPFPSFDPARHPDVTLADCDMLVIPAGAKHPREAFEFIAYVNSPGPMEKLCLGQLKFSPLATSSPEFLARHPHPHLRAFSDLAWSPNARRYPVTSTWTAYQSEMRNAVSRIWSGNADADTALATVEQRQQKNLDRAAARWTRMAPVLKKLWKDTAP